MKPFPLALALVTALAAAGSAQQRTATMLASIRSADSTQQPTMQITVDGRLHASLGFAKGDVGTLSLIGSTGMATGSLQAQLTDLPGSLVFSVPANGPELHLRVWPVSGAAAPRFEAQGHTVEIYRYADGTLGVRSVH